MLALAVFSTYVLMDTFVITRVYGDASDYGTEAALQADNTDDASSPVSDSTQDGAAEDSENSHANGPGSKPGNGSGRPSKGGPGRGGKHGKPGSSSGDSSTNSSHGKSSAKGSSSGRNSSASSSSKSSASDTSSSSTSSSGSNTSDSSGSSASSSAASSVSGKTTADSYTDDNLSITLSEYTVSDTAVHVAEVKADSAKYLKTAFAQGAYGKNVTATTSDIAESVNAILAINGDYYGTQEKGYVIRNGKLYRSTAVNGREDLVIYEDGSFEIINESEVTAEQLIAKGAVQTLSFGPALVENGSVSVDSNDEVGRAMASNPRTAIGVKSDGSYLFVVSDGRTSESEGLSLKELADFMKTLGAETAYNLDGGGSSTMVFNGSVVNTPTGGGIGNGSGSERKVSDIVYIGY